MTYLFDKALEEGYLVDVESWLMELADRDISDRIINMSNLSEQEMTRLITEGQDEIKMHFISKDYHIWEWFLIRFQKMGRKVGINSFDILKGIKDGMKNLIVKGKWPKMWSISGGTNDTYIREEILELLEKWDSEAKSGKTETASSLRA
jgi:hypothetical protein